MASPHPAPTAAFATSNRILAGALMTALVVIGVAISFVAIDPLDTLPPVWVPAAQVVAGVVVHVLLTAVGYRTAPLDTALDAQQAAALARQRWTSLQVLRFALAEVVAIASLAGGFVIGEALFLTYVGGAVVSLALMAVHVWPSRRTVGRFADHLESGGRQSGLREAFGYGGGGAIREL